MQRREYEYISCVDRSFSLKKQVSKGGKTKTALLRCSSNNDQVLLASSIYTVGAPLSVSVASALMEKSDS